MSSEILVAYFSASGTTAEIAREIASAVRADLYEIAPEVPYTTADLNWNNSRSRSSLEMNDPASRPAIAPGAPDLAQYGTVFIGFPIWWYVEPRIVDSFLDGCDLAGKTLIPFATSGGSGIERAAGNLKRQYPAGNWLPGRLLNRGGAAPWAKSVIR